MERAGFIDAPVIGPANIASKPTTPPIAIPAMVPISLDPVETLIITNIKMKVKITSRIKDCMAVLKGNVAPWVSCKGNNR